MAQEDFACPLRGTRGAAPPLSACQRTMGSLLSELGPVCRWSDPSGWGSAARPEDPPLFHLCALLSALHPKSDPQG